MATQSNHSLHEQPKGFKSVSAVPSRPYGKLTEMLANFYAAVMRNESAIIYTKNGLIVSPKYLEENYILKKETEPTIYYDEASTFPPELLDKVNDLRLDDSESKVKA